MAEYRELLEEIKRLDISEAEKAKLIRLAKAAFAYKDGELKERDDKIAILEEQLRINQQEQFGSSSEKLPGLPEPAQPINEKNPEVFNEAEVHAHDEDRPARKPGKKEQGKRARDASKYPHVKIYEPLDEDKRFCSVCGEQYDSFWYEETPAYSVLMYKPGYYYYEDVYTQKGACSHKNSDEHRGRTPEIVQAEAPQRIIDNSIASPSLIALILIEKYIKAVPYYRQEQTLIKSGIDDITRARMCSWTILVAQRYLLALYVRLIELLINEEEIIHADETMVQVIKEENRKATSLSYMWQYRTSGCAKHHIVIYVYTPTRSQEHPQEFLKDYKGYVHTDGYEGYHNLPATIIVVGCWAHARRYFEKAYKAMAVNQRTGSIAEMMLGYIQKMFGYEDEFVEANLPPDERLRKRLELVKPLSEEFFKQAQALVDSPQKVLPKSELGKAVRYAMNQRTYLENFFLDGRLEISNNRIERSMKPFAIGRNNWLFFYSVDGAESSQVIYSILLTAVENGLRPFEYMEYLLGKLPSAKASEIDDYLPWSDKLPVGIRVTDPFDTSAIGIAGSQLSPSKVGSSNLACASLA